MTKNIFLAFCLLLGYMPLVSGQNIGPVVEWQRCVGGTSRDQVTSSALTNDGGFIFVGYAGSGDGDLANLPNLHPFGSDFWVVKLSATRTIQWQKRLGGMWSDDAMSVIQTADGGYMVLGHTTSNDGDVACRTGNNSNTNIWLVKLSATGILQWQTCFGGSDYDMGVSVIQTKDGGYTILGNTASRDGDITGFHGTRWSDGWVVRVSATGALQWQKCLGGTESDGLRSIKQTSDGGYIIAGATTSRDGDITNYYEGNDAWVIKLSDSGAIQWQKSYGGTGWDSAASIVQTADGGYIFTGTTLSENGVVVGNRNNNGDIWVVKLTSVGVIEWQKCMGSSTVDEGNSIIQVADGGYVVAGFSTSNNGDRTQAFGFYDGWVFKLSPQGVLQWQKSLGGVREDKFISVAVTQDNGYLVTGFTHSDNLDGSGSHVNGTTWFVKLSSDAKVLVGRVAQTNTFCQSQTPPQYIANAQVKIEKNGAVNYLSADTLGRFGALLDTGRYTITTLAPNHLWTACPTQTVTLANPNIKDTTTVNPNLYVNSICPLVDVQLTTPFLRRCFESQYVINYSNKGTAIQNDATAELTLDSALTYISATRSVRSRVGNKITFSLGNVGINQAGQFTVTVLVSCDSRIGQTHCSSVLIPKTMTCDTVQDSIPSIVNQCRAGCDSVSFLVTKPNTTLNKTFKYQLIADATLMDTGRFVLTNTFSIKRKTDGKTYRLEIRNPTTNQLLAARSVESSPTPNTPSVSSGFVNQFAQAVKQTNIAENCTENRGSFDPNDKAAIPTGIGTRHFIEQGNTIEYLVRFQNTGTDTAFKVVVKDTLAAHFNLSSFKLNATSHAATWQLNPQGVLVVTFNNIYLVDSFTNEKGSHGFFKYSIKLKDSIVTNTIVSNRAAIYFDFNEPVITNLTTHTIGKEGLKSCLAKPTVSVSYSGCPSKNLVFNAISTSAGANPTYSWYRNNETGPLSINARLTLSNASNGTKIYCKLNASDDICTETPVVTSDTITLNCIGVPTNELSVVQTFDVFPNPNKGVFTVKLNVAKPTKMQLSILNYLGQTIKSEMITADNYAETFDLSAVPNGIYLIKLTIEGRSVVRKVSVQ